MSEQHVWTRVKASAQYVPMSPQKVRLVANLVRGKDLLESMEMLKFLPKTAAQYIYKLLHSAMSNAEENFGLTRDDLYVSEIYVDGGPIRKWRRFGARGRFKPILKRSSHITVVLEEYEE
ncbi:MAG: 50S ribosomal protein L22 [Anaerolineae bacterium]|nr:50S ribosomal protein L22 [Anaerolineae bacterium]